jgi:hypothetical protein
MGSTDSASYQITINEWFIIPPSKISRSNDEIPENFTLFQNYPNPANPETIIRYNLPVTADVSLVVYDVLGRKMRVLVNGVQTPGKYSVTWNGRDEFGNPVSSGIYIYQIRAGGLVSMKKMVLMR